MKTTNLDDHPKSQLLDDLLIRWEELAERGKPQSPDELCAEYPELAEALAGRINALQRMDQLFDTINLVEQSDTKQSITIRGINDDHCIDGYELLEKIGSGGMGVVYRAKQISLDRIVAVKTLLTGGMGTPEDVSRFHTEAEAAASLSHPNIVTIHDVGESNGIPYFSMDYVAGPSLAQLLQESSLSPRRAATYLMAIANAVQSAHENGILHRDLKPSNVLIPSDDKPMVTDFGLAKRIASDSKHTMTGQVLGTPSFMPPEQASGNIDLVDRRSDVYALGGIMYAMLTGHPPFRAESAVATIMQVINDQPVPPHHLNSGIDRDLETICMKCLEKNPQNRYASAGEVADECRRLLDGHPIVARPISTAERTVRWAGRNPAVAGLLSTIALIMIAATGVSTYFAVQSHRNAVAANGNAKQAIRNLAEMKVQRRLAVANAEKAEASMEEASKQTMIAETRLTELQKQTKLLQQSIGSYLKMYLQTCSVAGDIAAAENADRALAAFQRFDSTEQMIRNKSIGDAQLQILALLESWKTEDSLRPQALDLAIRQLVIACSTAWEHRCNSVFSGRRSSPGGEVRRIEREIVVQEIYNRAARAVRGLAATNTAEQSGHWRAEFYRLLWGEIPFVHQGHPHGRSVDQQMAAIHEQLKSWNSGPPPEALSQLADDLTAACKRSLDGE